MRVGKDLQTKALLALEEALQDARYGRVEPTRAIGFALAYLWASAGGSREPFTYFWRALQEDNELTRHNHAEEYLRAIYGSLGMPRDNEFTWTMWALAQERCGRRRKDLPAMTASERRALEAESERRRD